MMQVSVYELRLVKPIGPQNIATKIKTKRKRPVPEPEEPVPESLAAGPLLHQCSSA